MGHGMGKGRVMYETKWTVTHASADGSVVVRRNATIVEMGDGWIRILTQPDAEGRRAHRTVPLTMLTLLTRQED